MKMRWSLFIALLLLGAVIAEEQEDDNDAAVEEEDDEDEVPLDREETRNLRPRAYNQGGFPNTLPSGFRPTQSLAELAGYQQRPQQQQPQQLEQQQEYIIRPQQQVYIEEQRPAPVRAPHRKQQDQRPLKQQQELSEEEEEKEEPDRLSALLQQSKFNCVNKHTGYYADEELNCEVFHYCQDNVKHSWICPEGFTFHQVHLICMPPGQSDSICQKSSKYHFVNDYLYKPINEEEVQRKPSLALKYSDRYYPAEVYTDDRYEEEEEEEEDPRRAQQQQARPAPRPQYQPQQQVFRSAEEINIPLAQRRPQRPFDFDI